MAVPYVVTERGKPGDPAAPKKFYAQAKSSGELTFRQLAKEISEAGTTVSDTDVIAVLNDLVKIMRRNLSNGKIVRLGDFGAFQLSFGSEGAETEAKCSGSLIRNPKVLFRPGPDLRDMLLTLKYTKTAK